MLRDIRLRFWPTYCDCIRWSQDGAIAILANEYVYILVRTPHFYSYCIDHPWIGAGQARVREDQRDTSISGDQSRDSVSTKRWRSRKWAWYLNYTAFVWYSLVSLTGGSFISSGDIYSIGEEQGPGYVKAIEWSPLGMSHRRGYGLLLLSGPE